jgi:hypothetical protein
MHQYSITYMYYSLIGCGITILLRIVVSYITGKCGQLCLKILYDAKIKLHSLVYNGNIWLTCLTERNTNTIRVINASMRQALHLNICDWKEMYTNFCSENLRNGSFWRCMYRNEEDVNSGTVGTGRKSVDWIQLTWWINWQILVK